MASSVKPKRKAKNLAAKHQPQPVEVPANSPWMNIPQAAAYMGLSVMTLRRLRARGELLPRKMGDAPRGPLVWHKDDCDEWWENQPQVTAEA